MFVKITAGGNNISGLSSWTLHRNSGRDDAGNDAGETLGTLSNIKQFFHLISSYVI